MSAQRARARSITPASVGVFSCTTAGAGGEAASTPEFPEGLQPGRSVRLATKARVKLAGTMRRRGAEFMVRRYDEDAELVAEQLEKQRRARDSPGPPRLSISGRAGRPGPRNHWLSAFVPDGSPKTPRGRRSPLPCNSVDSKGDRKSDV